MIQVSQTLVDLASDQIKVRGQPIQRTEDKVYYILLNKPSSYLCSTRSRGQSKLVLDLFAEEGHRLFTVGRLDKDTQGLILVTNDGHFANQVGATAIDLGLPSFPARSSPILLNLCGGFR